MNKIMCDPFCEEVDIDRSGANTNTYGTYWMFFGWNYTGANGGPGMRRIGDRWTYAGARADILVQDLDVVQAGSPTTQWVSHPDADGVLTPASFNDYIGAEGAGQIVPWGATVSYWGAPTLARGTVDLNFGATDCSVTRYRDIPEFSNQLGAETTPEGMAQVGNFRNNDQTGQMGIVPRAAMAR